MRICTDPGSLELDYQTARHFDPDSLETDPALSGSRCVPCDQTYFPQKSRCPSCWEDVESIQLSRRGTVYTFAEVRAGPPKFDAPYTIGYVDLPEGVRVFSLLEDDPTLGVGDKVEVALGEIGEENNRPLYGYIFRRVE